MPTSDQGLDRDRYKLIPRTLTFLRNEDRILLLKGDPQKRLWSNQFNGVGGHVEKGEDILSSARREVFEETGIIPGELKLCGIVTVDTGEETGIGIFIFQGFCTDSATKVSREGTLEWIRFDQIDKLPLVKDLKVLLPRILSMQDNDQPFSAHYSYSNLDNQLEITFGE
jgi:8-oxo-dGTP diphosphatase